MIYEIKKIRSSMLAWANAYGILADTGLDATAIGEGDPDIIPFTDEHAEYFRTRKIVRVSSELRGGRNNSLRVFARLKIAKAKAAELERLFNERFADSKVTLEVGVSRPFKVENRLQHFGKLQPIHRDAGERICCGSSVGLGNQRIAGTLAALARDTRDGRLFGVSCNHVIGGCSTARPGTPIVVPGIQDVSADHPEVNVVGLHHRAAEMSQGLPSVSNIQDNSDLACFELGAPAELSTMQGSGDHAFDTPVTFAQPKIDLAVKKWGRSTGLTSGNITAILRDGGGIGYDVTSYFGPSNSQVFKGTVYYDRIYQVTNNRSAFSSGGDSGSLVVTHEARPRVVGILIAGSSKESYILPLKEVLKKLNLELLNSERLANVLRVAPKTVV